MATNAMGGGNAQDVSSSPSLDPVIIEMRMQRVRVLALTAMLRAEEDS